MQCPCEGRRRSRKVGGVKGHLDRKMLHSVSKAQDKGDFRNPG